MVVIYAEKSSLAKEIAGALGAGKGNIYGIYDERLNGNLVKLDCDKFRRYYPDLKDLNEENYSYQTNNFVMAVVNRIIDEIAPLKYNFIVKSSMKRPDVAFENANTLKPMGYSVELAVMGTTMQIQHEKNQYTVIFYIAILRIM